MGRRYKKGAVDSDFREPQRTAVVSCDLATKSVLVMSLNAFSLSCLLSEQANQAPPRLSMVLLCFALFCFTGKCLVLLTHSL